MLTGRNSKGGFGRGRGGKDGVGSQTMEEDIVEEDTVWRRIP